MQSVMILALILGFVLMSIALIGGTVLLAIRIVKDGSFSLRGRGIKFQDAKMMQQIHKGLSSMEERVNALETILMDREKERRLDEKL